MKLHENLTQKSGKIQLH
ncbi:unnamed protein product, partial [Rotaria sordida]